MMCSKPVTNTFTSFVLIMVLFSVGCQSRGPIQPSVVPGTSSTLMSSAAPGLVVTVVQSATPIPSPTIPPEPLALRVNGEGITQSEYQAELKQLQEALKTLGKTLSPEQQRQQVLDNLTDTLLLAQGAFKDGYQLSSDAEQAEIDHQAGQLGGGAALKTWITQQGYSEANFRLALKRQLAAAWQRDKITNAVPLQAEQVHARQILTIDQTIADKALELVKIPGTNFAAYAYRYDPQTGGDLGWFPRGYLTQPEVEAAAFTLQPGEISPVIKSQNGYHIIQVIAREPARTISPDARRVLQHNALQDWLRTRREGSQVEVLLP